MRIEAFEMLFNPHRKVAVKPTKTEYALFPCGKECEIIRLHNPINMRVNSYRLTTPDGKKEQNTKLADLKHFLEMDYPGVIFRSKKA